MATPVVVHEETEELKLTRLETRVRALSDAIVKEGKDGEYEWAQLRKALDTLVPPPRVFREYK